jgi:DNA-binding transcriptional MocR family regulator
MSHSSLLPIPVRVFFWSPKRAPPTTFSKTTNDRAIRQLLFDGLFPIAERNAWAALDHRARGSRQENPAAHYCFDVTARPAATMTATAAAAASAAARVGATAAAAAASSRFTLPTVPPALALLPSTSVWLEFTPLADLTVPPAINLGQGFPDWAPPAFLTRAVPGADAAASMHQYARSAGHIPLVNAIARQYAPRLKPASNTAVAAAAAALSSASSAAMAHQGSSSSSFASSSSSSSSSINPKTEVLVTAGASHALSLAISALAGPGDKVVLIEPAFDVYTGAVLTAGASPVYVPMKCRHPGVPAKSSADFILDMHELAAAFDDKTKLIVLNSPHNPTGKVFSAAEMHDIARIVQAHPRCAIISDEVYEHMTYNESLPHIPFASLSPDMYDRTISMYVWSPLLRFSSDGTRAQRNAVGQENNHENAPMRGIFDF